VAEVDNILGTDIAGCARCEGATAKSYACDVRRHARRPVADHSRPRLGLTRGVDPSPSGDRQPETPRGASMRRLGLNSPRPAGAPSCFLCIAVGIVAASFRETPPCPRCLPRLRRRERPHDVQRNRPYDITSVNDLATCYPASRPIFSARL
jgi:hypothetical protein